MSESTSRAACSIESLVASNVRSDSSGRSYGESIPVIPLISPAGPCVETLCVPSLADFQRGIEEYLQTCEPVRLDTGEERLGLTPISRCTRAGLFNDPTLVGNPVPKLDHLGEV